MKDSQRVLVRVPGWTQKADVKAFVGKRPAKVRWENDYVSFDKVKRGQQLTVTYPLRLAEVREPIQGVVYTERWRGNTIVDISPPGKWIPMFQRPEFNNEHMPD